MPPFLLALIPTIIKAVLNLRETKGGITKAAPLIGDAIGVSLNPLKNKKALIAASITLLAYYGVTVGPEWVAFLGVAIPAIAAFLFTISKPKSKETKT